MIFIGSKYKLARQVAALLKDGRPAGCTCPPHPMIGAMPNENHHIGDKRCPYTAIAQSAGGPV